MEKYSGYYLSVINRNFIIFGNYQPSFIDTLNILLIMVQHKKQFYLTIDGEKYKAIYLNHGWSYSTLSIQKEVKFTMRKFLLFGKKVEKTKWVEIIFDSRSQYFGETSVIDRKKFYDENQTRKLVKEAVDAHYSDKCRHNPYLD